MSSKTDPEEGTLSEDPRHAFKAWSLATRLTIWYAGSSFLLVILATTYLYWAMMGNVNREDDALLADKVRVVQAVLQHQPNDTAAIRQEVEDTWRARENEKTYVRVIHENGQVLVESPSLNQMLPATAFPPPSIEPGQGTDVHPSKDQAFRIIAVRDVGSPWTIQLAMDRDLESQILSDYLRHLWYVLAIALIVCVVVGYGIAHRGVRPIHLITETTRRIGPTNLSERLRSHGLPAELLALAATFNKMLDQLEQSFTRLSRFSADIAHELRTPVSSLRGEVEVALRQPRTSDEYREVLHSNLEECGRLAHIIDRLLFLARAENPEQQIIKEPCDIKSELATICGFYDAVATEAGVTLAVVPNDQATADIDRALFQRAIGNLVANAIAHTPANGNVTLSAKEHEHFTEVRVTDSGCGIEAVHLPHVFDRLYRADNSRSSKTGRIGLGLAIVRTIVELHGGTVQISSEVGKGTLVSLSFPRNADDRPDACNSA